MATGSDLFAGTVGDGVYRSTDNGGTWAHASSGIPISYNSIFSLIAMPPYIYAGVGASGGVYRSSNSGTSWTSTSGLASSVNALVVAGSFVVAGSSYGAIWRSTNNGMDWSLTQSGLGNAVNSLAVKPGATGASIVLAATSNKTVYRSTDDGAKWSQVTSGLTDPVVWSMTFSGSHFFAGTQAGGVFRSSDNGVTWASAGTGLPVSPIWALLVSGTNIFAGTDNGVYLSTNNGTNWNPVNTGLPPYTGVRSLAATATHIVAGTFAGAWRRSLNEMVTSAGPVQSTIPSRWTLEQNFPNPFNPSTIIRYGLPARAHVILTVFNTIGQQVAVLQNGALDAGYHETIFNADGFASGVYLYRLQAGDFSQVRTLILIR